MSNNSIQRFSHVGICVSDLDRSLAFHRDALGFREVGRLDVTGEAPETLLGLRDVALEAVFLERDGVRIELLHYR
jgi:catechol 2,3-dioxygenase-like lactoylglutathione lyase family enzyme